MAAIYDPTQQIQQIGQQNNQMLQQFGDNLVQGERNKNAQIERIYSQIEAITEEAAPMHREFLQEEVDSTLSELSEHIFQKRKKHSGLRVDVQGFAGLKKKISRLKNMATNSQVAATMAEKYEKMALADPYIYNKPATIGQMIGMISDKEALAQNPDSLARQFEGLYRAGVDKAALMIDYLKKNVGTEVGFGQYVDKTTNDTIEYQYDKYKGIHDNYGNLTDDGVMSIMEAAREKGFSISMEEARQIGLGLGSKRGHKITESGLKKEQDQQKLAIQQQKAIIDQYEFQEKLKAKSLKPFIDSFVSDILYRDFAVDGKVSSAHQALTDATIGAINGVLETKGHKIELIYETVPSEMRSDIKIPLSTQKIAGVRLIKNKALGDNDEGEPVSHAVPATQQQSKSKVKKESVDYLFKEKSAVEVSSWLSEFVANNMNEKERILMVNDLQGYMQNTINIDEKAANRKPKEDLTGGLYN